MPGCERIIIATWPTQIGLLARGQWFHHSKVVSWMWWSNNFGFHVDDGSFEVIVGGTSNYLIISLDIAANLD